MQKGKLDDTEAATALDTLMEWAIFEDVDSKSSTDIYRRSRALRLATNINEGELIIAKFILQTITYNEGGFEDAINHINIYEEQPLSMPEKKSLHELESLRSILRRSEYPEEGTTKNVLFSSAKFRFFDYCIGEGVPRRGPSIGLSWDWESHGEVEISIVDLENLRGGFSGEGDQEQFEIMQAKALEEPNKGYSSNLWRIQREDFAKYGSISLERRMALLALAGHRRASIDLNTSSNKSIARARRQEARSKMSQYALDGIDIEVLHELYERNRVAKQITQWGRKRLESWKDQKRANFL